MTAMRMGQGVDIVMNGYAMGAQNQQQAPGMAAAAHMAANNRFRPAPMGGPIGPMAVAPLPQQVQQVSPVVRIMQPTVVPGGRIPEKPPVHSLTVQELKELTRMRLARESLGPNAAPVIPAVTMSASPIPSTSSSAEAALGEHTELINSGPAIGPGTFRSHAVRQHSGNSLMTLTTVESRESSDYSAQTLPSRSSTTSPVSDSAFLDSEVNAVPCDSSSLAGLGLAAGGSGTPGAASQRRQQQQQAANTQQINGAMLEAQRRDLRASLRGDAAESLSALDVSGQGQSQGQSQGLGQSQGQGQGQGQASGGAPAGRSMSNRVSGQPYSPMSGEAQAQAMARLRMEQRALLQAQQQVESQQQQQQQQQQHMMSVQQQQMMDEHRRTMARQQMDAGAGFMNNRPDAMGFASLSLGDLPDQGPGMGMGKRVGARTPSPGFGHPLQMHATHDQAVMAQHQHQLGPGAVAPQDMYGPHGGPMMVMMGGPRTQPPPPPPRHSPLQMVATETDSGMGHAPPGAHGFYPINTQPQSMELIGPNGQNGMGSGLPPMPQPLHPREGSPSMRHKSTLGMPNPTPLRERAISDMREGESDGLAFECAEAVLDFGSSPPSTPKSTHKTLQPAEMPPPMAPLGAQQEDWPLE